MQENTIPGAWGKVVVGSENIKWFLFVPTVPENLLLFLKNSSLCRHSELLGAL